MIENIQYKQDANGKQKNKVIELGYQINERVI